MSSLERTNLIAALVGLVPLAIAAVIGVIAAVQRRREVIAGAPLYPGRWAAIAWFYWAGEFFGEVSIFNGFTWREWTLTGVGLFVFLPLGIVSLDRYARQAYFAGNPTGVWNGLTTNDIDRRRWLWTKS